MAACASSASPQAVSPVATRASPRSAEAHGLIDALRRLRGGLVGGKQRARGRGVAGERGAVHGRKVVQRSHGVRPAHVGAEPVEALALGPVAEVGEDVREGAGWLREAVARELGDGAARGARRPRWPRAARPRRPRSR